MLHPKLKGADLGNDGIDLHRHRLSWRNVLDRLQIDLEQADFQQFFFGIGYDLTRVSPLLTSDEKNRNSAGCPVTSARSRASIKTSDPSSIPCGTTHSAFSGGLKPGTAGIDVSSPI